MTDASTSVVRIAFSMEKHIKPDFQIEHREEILTDINKQYGNSSRYSHNWENAKAKAAKQQNVNLFTLKFFWFCL